ncbi:hypothetical protein K1719_041923 [Acacia pycnantha]|nr:hypothetical protein K1719_041923 [Acacia pycnantha]
MPPTMCGVLKEEIIGYDECLIRYSNHSIFSTILNTENVSNQPNFIRTLYDTMNHTTDEVAKPDAGCTSGTIGGLGLCCYRMQDGRVRSV